MASLRQFLICVMMALPVFGLKLHEIILPPATSKIFEPSWKEIITESEAIVRNHTIDWGKKTLVSYCPDNMYAWGYILVRDTNSAQYNTGFNRIDLLCYGKATAYFHFSEATRITTNFNLTYNKKGQDFKFSEDVRLCEFHNGPLRSYTISYQDTKQRGRKEVGVVGFQGICWDSTPLPQIKEFESHLKNIELLVKANGTCGRGMAMCGYQLRYQIEGNANEFQIKSVVDVDPYCCKVTNELDQCIFEKKYKVIANVDNRGNSRETKEKMRVERKIQISKRITQIQDEKWIGTSEKTLSEDFAVTRLREVVRSETNTKFDREISILGMFQGIGDMMTGIGYFLKKGLGKLLGADGLGEILGVGGLPKLVGDGGLDNLATLDETGLNFHFDNTNFGNMLRTDLRPIFHNLDEIGKGPEFRNMVSFYGYGETVNDVGKIIGYWKPSTHSDAMSKLVGSSLTTFQHMELRDIIGIYGLAKMYGKSKVYAMINSGDLAKMFNIGGLGSKSWGDGVGRIVDSANIGKLYSVYALAKAFSKKGVGRELGLEKLVDVIGIISNTDAAIKSIFGEEEISTTKWIQTVEIYLLSQILDKGSPQIEEVYAKLGLSDELGVDGLAKILGSEELKTWFDKLNENIKNADNILQNMAVVALQPLIQDFSRIITGEPLKKLIGSLKYEEIVGTKENLTPEDMEKVSSLYILKDLFGNLEGATLPLSVKTEVLEKMLKSKHFGSTISLFVVGKILQLYNLEKMTGHKPLSLTALQETSGVQGRFVGELISGLGASVVKGISSVAGTIFSKLFGENSSPNRPKRVLIETEKRTLTELRSTKRAQAIKETQSVGSILDQALTRTEVTTKTETIDTSYAPNILTLVVVPRITCDEYLSVDLVDKKNYITILIPESGNCDPVEYYNVVQDFDYLDQNIKEKRSYFIEVGTSWEGMYPYTRHPEIKDIILQRDPTRGVKDRIKRYKDELTGKNNVAIKNILTRDLNVKQVWNLPETYEGESLIYPYNYNIILQLRMKCHEVSVLSSLPLLVRIPKLFGCSPKGVWEPLEYDRTKKGAFIGYIGLKNGGKDVDGLNDIQRGIPEISSQLQRLAKELQHMFIATTNATTPSDASWTRDTTLIRNPAWTVPNLEKDVVDIGDGRPVIISQLIAKCGPVAVALHKYKVKYTDDKSVKYLPKNLLLTTGIEESNEECPPHFPC